LNCNGFYCEPGCVEEYQWGCENDTDCCDGLICQEVSTECVPPIRNYGCGCEDASDCEDYPFVWCVTGNGGDECYPQATCWPWS
jgi:hypothetical protein